VAGLLRALLYRTRAGTTMRATVDDRALTMLNGARPDRSAMLAWAIGCSTAALSGILIAPDRGLQHGILTLLIVNAYAAAVLGRLRNLPLAFLGAVVLGLADAYGNGYIRVSEDFLGGLGLYLGGFVSAIPVLLLFVTLLALPHAKLQGRRPARRRERYPTPTWAGTVAGIGLLLVGTGVVATLVTDADGVRLQKLFAVAVVALSLVPLVGYAGQISLCPMSFAGIGAIVMAHHGGGGSIGGLVLAAVVAGAVGALIALPALRLSGIYLALATGAFAVVLDRWIFLLPAFDVGPVHVELFGQAGIPVPRLHFLGIDDTDPRAELLVFAAVFCVLWAVVVGVRRSAFGERLLAMKDSPAACATLGLDLTVTKLAVFSLSAAIAGIGGALFGGASASVSPDSFAFFQSLPVLLLAVVGGIGTPLGALLGASTLYLIPTLAGTIGWLEKPSSVLPGLIGVSLGRNPNGVAADLGARLAPLRPAPAAFGGMVVAMAALVALYQAGGLPGWPLAVLLFLAPFIAARVAGAAEAAATAEPDLAVEWLGLDAPVAEADLRRIDLALALPVVAP
jgi:branched-chain amino acid transport system permease protein